MKPIPSFVVLAILLISGGVLLFTRGDLPERASQATSRGDWAHCEQQVAANILITRPGTYCSSDGNRAVCIEQTSEGMLTYAVSGTTSAGPFSIALHEPFAADGRWFMCWDETGELWSYVPELGIGRAYTKNGTVYMCVADSIDGHNCGTELNERRWHDGMPRIFREHLPEILRTQVSDLADTTPQPTSSSFDRE